MTLSNLALAYQQLGSLAQANTAMTNSLNLLDSLARNTPKANSTQSLLAQQALDIQARLQLALGQPGNKPLPPLLK